MIRSYTDGFNALLSLLTAVTMVTAVIVLLFLRRGGTEAMAAEVEISEAPISETEISEAA